MATALYNSLGPDPRALPTGGYWTLNREQRDRVLAWAKQRLRLPRIPTDEQLQVLVCSNRTMREPVLYGGAMGGGKSALLCMLGISLCRLVPRNRVLMFRKEYSAFASSTLQELEEQIELCPDASRYGSSEFHFTNGSEIWFTGVGTAKQRQKLGSTQFGALLGDEVPEIEYDTFINLLTRLRHPPAARANQLMVCVTANPWPGWVRDNFVTRPRPGWTFIQSKAENNPYLYNGYVEDMMATLPTEYAQAMIGGDWFALAAGGSAIPYSLLLEMSRRTEEPSDDDECVWGIDVGHVGHDATSIWQRWGLQWRKVRSWVHEDTVESRRMLASLIEQAPSLGFRRPDYLNIDCTGVGAGLYDQVREMEYEGLLYNAHARYVHAGAGAVDAVHYGSIKAENMFKLRAILDDSRGQLVANTNEEIDMAISDLAAPEARQRNGRTIVDPNEVVKRTLGRSPNDGDAILLTLHSGGRQEVPRSDEERIREQYLASLTPEDRMIEEAALESRAKREQAAENLLRNAGVRVQPPDDFGVGY